MKVILILSLLFFTSSVSFAQMGKSEVSLGYGFGTANQFIDSFLDALTTGLTFGNYTVEDKSYTGSINLGYNFNVTGALGVGGVLSYESVDGDVYIQNQKRGTQKNKFYTVLGGVKVNYINTSTFNLYSGVYGGLSSRNAETKIDNETSNDSESRFAFHLSAIGARLGTNIGGFIEAGFGDLGLLRLGISGRF